MSNQNLRLTYLVPRDTDALLQQEIVMSRCENLSLILARYIPQEVIRNESVGRFDKWREQWLKDVCRRFDNSQQNADWQRLAVAYFERWKAMTKGALVFEAQLEGAMVIGLGAESVLESNITLHTITGLPYIPATALKGLTRAYALFSIAAQIGVPVLTGDALLSYLAEKKNDKAAKTPLDILDELLAAPSRNAAEKQTWSELFEKLNTNAYMTDSVPVESIQQNKDVAHFRVAFGSQAKAGACIFFDAVLSDLPPGLLFDVDVMTSHYPDYYSSEGQTAPSDDQSPNPIQFLSVANQTRFMFAVGVQPRRASELNDLSITPEQFNKAILNWFQSGLRDMGIGAKTHAGYGLFRILK